MGQSRIFKKSFGFFKLTEFLPWPEEIADFSRSELRRSVFIIRIEYLKFNSPDGASESADPTLVQFRNVDRRIVSLKLRTSSVGLTMISKQYFYLFTENASKVIPFHESGFYLIG